MIIHLDLLNYNLQLSEYLFFLSQYSLHSTKICGRSGMLALVPDFSFRKVDYGCNTTGLKVFKNQVSDFKETIEERMDVTYSIC